MQVHRPQSTPPHRLLAALLVHRDLPRHSVGCTMGHFVRRFRAVLWSAARGVLPDALCTRDPFERAGSPWELLRPCLSSPWRHPRRLTPCHRAMPHSALEHKDHLHTVIRWLRYPHKRWVNRWTKACPFQSKAAVYPPCSGELRMPARCQ